MAIRVALNHVTSYRFDRPVQLSPHVVRLRPAPHCRTPIVAYSLRVTPASHFLNWQQDPFGNYQARLVLPKAADELRLEVDLIADLTTINPFDFFLEEPAEKFPFQYEALTAIELAPYLAVVGGGDAPDRAPRTGAGRDRSAGAAHGRRAGRYQPADPALAPLRRAHGAGGLFRRKRPWFAVTVPAATSPGCWCSCCGASASRPASCRATRSSFAPTASPRRARPASARTCTDLHAWAEAYLPGAGWVGLDPTSGLFCGEGHIPLACTPEPSSAAPVTGSFAWEKRHEDEELEQSFTFGMSVRRLDDPPRPSKPYDEKTWEAILSCGDEVDEALRRQDVRLTMGGEPTFVSLDDRDGEEWNTVALGPSKLALAEKLARALQGRFAPGGLLHHGQGKWYPGEPLPRWAISCYFRKDGQPLWRDPALHAEETVGKPAGEERDPRLRRIAVSPPGGGALVPAARIRGRALLSVAGAEAAGERRSARRAASTTSKERARIRRVLDRGLGRVVGLALPLTADSERRGRRRGPFRQRVVVPARRTPVSPARATHRWVSGCRSIRLPWAAPVDRVFPIERDPLAARGPLPRALGCRSGPGPASGEPAPRSGRPRRRPGPVVPPRAWCARPSAWSRARGCCTSSCRRSPPSRNTWRCSPPSRTPPQSCSSRSGVEGYHPPSDHRLERIQVTPDPGVLEVNIHPAALLA